MNDADEGWNPKPDKSWDTKSSFCLSKLQLNFNCTSPTSENNCFFDPQSFSGAKSSHRISARNLQLWVYVTVNIINTANKAIYLLGGNSLQTKWKSLHLSVSVSLSWSSRISSPDLTPTHLLPPSPCPTKAKLLSTFLRELTGFTFAHSQSAQKTTRLAKLCLLINTNLCRWIASVLLSLFCHGILVVPYHWGATRFSDVFFLFFSFLFLDQRRIEEGFSGGQFLQELDTFTG